LRFNVCGDADVGAAPVLASSAPAKSDIGCDDGAGLFEVLLLQPFNITLLTIRITNSISPRFLLFMIPPHKYFMNAIRPMNYGFIS
jgi:hypothetical protein